MDTDVKALAAAVSKTNSAQFHCCRLAAPHRLGRRQREAQGRLRCSTTRATDNRCNGTHPAGRARLHTPELGAPDGAARERAAAGAQHHAAPAVVRHQRVLHARARARLQTPPNPLGLGHVAQAHAPHVQARQARHAQRDSAASARSRCERNFWGTPGVAGAEEATSVSSS